MGKKLYIRQKLIWVFIISVFYLFPSISHSDPPVLPVIGKQIRGKSDVKQIGPNEYKIGGVILNKNRKEMYLPGSINMQSGLVEYLACHAEVGKLHESVLKVEAKPSDLQVGLLLLGCKAHNNVKFQGDPTIPEGDLLEIWVEWELQDKTKKRVRAEELVYDQEKKKPMDKTYWIFTGSQIIDGQFMADIEGSIIATFRDPAALINNPLPSGADDTIYVSNEKILPPQGTNVLLTVKVPQQGPSEDSSSKKDLKSNE